MPVTASRRIRQFERIALAVSVLLGIGASIWVLASRELSDFLGEGPVRVFGIEDGERQLLIGSGTLVAVLVAGAVTWRRPLPLWRYAIGGMAFLVALALAPPLFVPMVALYALAFAAAVLARTPPERVATFAPRRHPLAWAGGSAAGLAAVVVIAWVSVWLLRPLWDEGRELDEALAFEVTGATAVASPNTRPSVDATRAVTPASPVEAVSTAEPTPTPTPGQTGAVLAMGQLLGTDSFHFGSGSVRLLRGPAGEVVLRFEEYEVRNGPDLFVYLTPDPGGDVGADGALDLGAIRATRGNVNYEVPSGVDTSAFRSAVIWCRSFDVVFAVATFE